MNYGRQIFYCDKVILDIERWRVFLKIYRGEDKLLELVFDCSVNPGDGIFVEEKDKWEKVWED